MKQFFLINLLCFSLGLFAQSTSKTTQTDTQMPSLIVRYDNHGLELGEQNKTLFKISLPEEGFDTDSIYIDFVVDRASEPYITDFKVLLSDSLVTRDLDDYKERVHYQLYPLLSGSRSFVIPLSEIGSYRTIYLVADIATGLPTGLDKSIRVQVGAIRYAGKRITFDTFVEGAKEAENHSISHQMRNASSDRRVFESYKPLFVPGDTGSRNFRIPAFVKSKTGTLIAVADRRKFNQTDIPEDIDLIQRRSFDGGVTWTAPEILVQGKGYGKGYGDAALVQTNSGKLVMIFIGGPGLWHSTPEKPQPTYVMTSDDDGTTWSEMRDITHFLYGKDCKDPIRRQFLSSFCASGQGTVTKDGRIMFVAAMRTSKEYVLDNYLIYSDDEGKTWNVSELACSGGDEAKVMALANGAILMSVRNQKTGDRIFKISLDNGVTWKDQKKLSGLYDPACNGALLMVQHEGRTHLIHSLPFGRERIRKNGVIYRYQPEQRAWSEPVLINPGWSAYSDMLILDEEHIGYFVEEDSEMSLVFIKVRIADLFK